MSTWPASMRASDDDRERCLRDLRAAYAEGRIDAGELERRAGRAAVAQTRAELAWLVRDVPAQRPPAWVRALDRVDRVVVRAHATAFGVANGSLVGVWAATGQGEFWPAWLLVPWTPLLAWHLGGSWSVRRLVRRRWRARRSVDASRRA
jgi:hypothetical protein